MCVAKQNLLFSYFAATLGAEIRAAKAEGRYFEGMSELAGTPTLKQVLRAESRRRFNHVCKLSLLSGRAVPTLPA